MKKSIKINLMRLLFFSIFLCILTTRLNATNLGFKGFIRPLSLEQQNEGFYPKFEVDNKDWAYDESGSNWNVTLKFKYNGITQWENDIPGVNINRYSTVTVTGETMFVPEEAGDWELEGTLNYAWDKDYSNNTINIAFEVEENTTTDLLPISMIKPSLKETFGDTIKPKIRFRNQGYNYDVEYNEWVWTIKMIHNGTEYWRDNNVIGGKIDNNSTLEMEATKNFSPDILGTWQCQVTVDYTPDMVPGNNDTTWNFEVEAPGADLYSERLYFTIGQGHWIYNIYEYHWTKKMDSLLIYLHIRNSNDDEFTVEANSYSVSINLKQGGNTFWTDHITETQSIGPNTFGICASSKRVNFEQLNIEGDIICEVTVQYLNDKEPANNIHDWELSVEPPPSAPSQPEDETGIINNTDPEIKMVINEGNVDSVEVKIAEKPEEGEPDWDEYFPYIYYAVESPGLNIFQIMTILEPNTAYLVRIRLRNFFLWSTGTTWLYNTTSEQTDLGINVTKPTQTEFDGKSFKPEFTIKNYGTTTVEGSDWNVDFKIAETLDENFTGSTLDPGEQITLQSSTVITPTESRSVITKVNCSGDIFADNDNHNFTMKVYGPVSEPAYDFNPPNGTTGVPYNKPTFNFKAWNANADNPPVTEAFLKIYKVNGSDILVCEETISVTEPECSWTIDTDLEPLQLYRLYTAVYNPAGGTAWNIYFTTRTLLPDLGIEQFIRPFPWEKKSDIFNPSCIIKNYGGTVVAGGSWSLGIAIRDCTAIIPDLLFNETVSGKNIEPGATVLLTATGNFNPNILGNDYWASAQLNYSDDNPDNNEKSKKFNVYNLHPSAPESPINPINKSEDINPAFPLLIKFEQINNAPILEINLGYSLDPEVTPTLDNSISLELFHNDGIVSALWPEELQGGTNVQWMTILSNKAGKCTTNVWEFSTLSGESGKELLPGQVEFSQAILDFPLSNQERSPNLLIIVNACLINTDEHYKKARGANLEDKIGYINVSTSDGWVVQNMVFDPTCEYEGMSTFFHHNGNDEVTSLQAYVFFSPEPVDNFNYAPVTEFEVESFTYNAQGRNDEIQNTGTPIPFEDIPFDSEGKTDVVWQHGHKNIEQGKNQCGPASLANSLQWLEDTKGIDVPHETKSGIRDNSLVGEIDKAMNRAGDDGVSDENMLNGKLKYINDNNLSDDLIVKHKNRKGTNFVSNDTVKVGNTKSIAHTDTSVSLIDWIISELKHGEDVELGIGWDGTNKGHWVDLIGGGYVEGVPWIAWVHDTNQGTDDNGTPADKSDDKVKKNGGITAKTGGIQSSYVINNKLKSGISVGTIDLALSESKDSTETNIWDNNEIQKPSGYRLEQNYPNPFNPSTIIKYHIPKRSKINITIFDINGEEVKTIINEYKNPGSHSIKFIADKELASGIYFYSLKIKNNSITKKAVLLR